LGEREYLVSDVHQHRVRVHDVEGRILEGELVDGRGDELRVVDRSLGCGCPGSLDLSRVGVDPDHATRSDRRGEVEGDAADSTAHVEDVHAGTHVRQQERQEPVRVAVGDVPVLHALFDHVALIDTRTLVRTAPTAAVQAGWAEMSSRTARLYATTGTSAVRLDETCDGWNVAHELRGSGAQCLAVDPADPDTVYVGLAAGGLRKTVDGGRNWGESGLDEEQIFSVAVSAADGAVYAGTEPSALYRSDDRGETWRELPGLLELPSQPTWSFPPRPWTSHVRWIAPSPNDARTILAGIELGGLMRSTDRGETWQDHRPGAQPDVHSLAWHPRVEGRAYEAGGGGAAWSADGGETWRPADEGRDRHYTWSVAVDPEDPELWYVSASS